VAHLHQTKIWQARLPDGWQVRKLRFDCATLFKQDGVGMLDSTLVFSRSCVYGLDMANRNDLISLQRLLRPLRRELTAELADALLRLKADAQVQARYDELAGKNSQGALTSVQRAELESLVRANSLLTLLKAEARASLRRPKAA
jgi:phage terminase large subunit-like protein